MPKWGLSSYFNPTALGYWPYASEASNELRIILQHFKTYQICLLLIFISQILALLSYFNFQSFQCVQNFQKN